MKTETLNEDTLRRYLLDDISEGERRIIEERFFEDDSFFDEILALEDELYFDYQQNRLDGRQRAAFERKFLQSPKELEKAAFADAFIRASAEQAGGKFAAEDDTARDTKSSSRWQSIAAFFNFSNPTLQFGFGAVLLLLLLGAIGLFIQNSNRRNEIANLENSSGQKQKEQIIAQKERQTAERQVEGGAPQTAQSEKQPGEIETERLPAEREIAESKEFPHQSSPKSAAQRPKNPALSPQQRSVIALILRPGLLTRSGGEGASRAILSQTTKKLQIRLLLKNEYDYQSYRAVIKTLDDGTEVWKSADLKPRQNGKNKSLTLSIPASVLQRADYEVSLLGLTPNGQAEEITSYYFSVAKNGVKKL